MIPAAAMGRLKSAAAPASSSYAAAMLAASLAAAKSSDLGASHEVLNQRCRKIVNDSEGKYCGRLEDVGSAKHRSSADSARLTVRPTRVALNDNAKTAAPSTTAALVPLPQSYTSPLITTCVFTKRDTDGSLAERSMPVDNEVKNIREVFGRKQVEKGDEEGDEMSFGGSVILSMPHGQDTEEKGILTIHQPGPADYNMCDVAGSRKHGLERLQGSSRGGQSPRSGATVPFPACDTDSALKCHSKLSDSCKGQLPRDSSRQCAWELGVIAHPSECPVCGIMFFHQCNLDRHIGEEHQGLKLFHCPDCLHSFPQKHDVLTHLRLVHGVDCPFPRPYPCHLCFTAFDTAHRREEHMTKQHPKHDLVSDAQNGNGIQKRKTGCNDTGRSFYEYQDSHGHQSRTVVQGAYPAGQRNTFSNSRAAKGSMCTLQSNGAYLPIPVNPGKYPEKIAPRHTHGDGKQLESGGPRQGDRVASKPAASAAAASFVLLADRMAIDAATQVLARGGGEAAASAVKPASELIPRAERKTLAPRIGDRRA